MLERLKSRRIRRYLEALDRPRVVVHLKSGTSIRGILAGVYDDVVVITHAEHLSASVGSVGLDGEQMIERTQVDFMQKLGEVSS